MCSSSTPKRAIISAERFDKPLADLFDMQDEIVARLADTLNAHLVAAEARRAEQGPNPDSMDLYFQGLAWYNKGLTADHLAQARGFFDRALIADPDNVEALVGSAPVDVVAGALSCDRSHGRLCCGGVKIDRSPVVGIGPRAWPYVLRTCRHTDEARGTGHRRMSARAGARSKSCHRPFFDRNG